MIVLAYTHKNVLHIFVSNKEILFRESNVMIFMRTYVYKKSSFFRTLAVINANYTHVKIFETHEALVNYILDDVLHWTPP